MPNCKKPYEPREDSTLLETYVRQHAKGNVLDMGTGSGIQTITAAHSNKVNSVLALDVQKKTIEYCRQCIKNKKIRFAVSDLFEIFKKDKRLMNKKFDAIIFNPPYLPDELKIKDLTIEGGKKGYEVLEKFLNNVNNYLKNEGIILIVFSSLTKKEKVNEFIKNNLLEFELLEKQHYLFEDLYVYSIQKSGILKKLEKIQIKSIGYFKKGKRGFIFTGNFKGKKVAVKIKNPESSAVLRIENEANFLKKLNKKGIGPKLLFFGDDFIVYEFVDGISFTDFLKNKNSNKNIVLKLIKNIFNQLFILDKLNINKEEMSHPQKHILINSRNKPVLIDFERCHYSIKPGNVTQFCDFLMSGMVKTLLKNKRVMINNEKIINAAREYKKIQSKINFMRIIGEIK